MLRQAFSYAVLEVPRSKGWAIVFTRVCSVVIGGAKIWSSVTREQSVKWPVSDKLNN